VNWLSIGRPHGALTGSVNGKHGKDYIFLAPEFVLVVATFAEIADLEVKFRTTQDDAR
jgi:hypothetical protein